MNTKPRNPKVTGILLLAMFMLALLAACSGGNIDVAVGGVNIPPGTLPPFSNSEPIAAQGTLRDITQENADKVLIEQQKKHQ